MDTTWAAIDPPFEHLLRALFFACGVFAATTGERAAGTAAEGAVMGAGTEAEGAVMGARPARRRLRRVRRPAARPAA